ncbi:MAG: TonB-dependent receptor [Cyclobacteriaceae bacterium]|nr:TonB-dependent receptor [Cyclobacteriaceae bacterium]MCB0500122.1 TonB-dependent receptor [Cyclobacteriaceae bacterium]MCB9237149.1 TonB-dependent receptor [Flammeovirgaceae bacterium]MCO5270858.1 TonB-dependent receptor [Cyclobacteriaceae bacterium]MCW5901856.1 TonB-dependent receptor [Cyclobacteriaceae bacterium]
MKKLLLLGSLWFAGIVAFGQGEVISGRVVSSEDNTAIPGVNVILKGTVQGTVTDANGNYRINKPSEGGTLVFSFVGFKTQEVPIGNQTSINITLESEVGQLAEVVVVGYGTQQKEAITGSVGSLDNTKLEQVPMASFEQTLQGNLAGVQATGIDGSPGANTQIRIRGIGSITASSEPLYVIDGIPVTSGNIAELNDNGDRSANVMAGINPNDIESVTVLKDASSTAIYGSRGANGVILITTKSGKQGKPRIDIKTQVGFNNVASKNLLKPLNADQYTQLFLEGYTNRGDTPAQAQSNFDSRFTQLIDPSTGLPTNTDWLESVTRTGANQSYDISASGATDNVKYFLSGSYFDQQSYIIGTDFSRLSTRLNLEVKATDFLTISNNLSVSNTDQNGMVDGSAWANPLYNAYLLSPLIPIRDDQGRFNAEHKNYFPMGGNNPVGALSGDDARNTTQLRLIDNFAVTVKFLKNFTARSQWNVDAIQVDEYQYKNPRYGDGRNSGGYAQENTVLDKNWVGTQTLTYGVTLGGRHNVEALVGYEAQESKRKTLYGYGESFPNDKLKTLASAAAAFDTESTRTGFTFNSILSRVNYDFDGKYFFSASLRRDGSSRFGRDSRWGTFYSVGGAWNVTAEDFLSGATFIDNLKLRTSYGVTGNAAIGNFPSVGLYAYGQDYDGAPGGAPSQIANPLLTWESQENFNVGLDFSLLNRVNGTVDYFSRVSSDLILDVPVSRTTGFQSLTQNFGEMKNSGLELSLNATVLQLTDFSWSVGFNTTLLKNKITKLKDDFNDGTKRRQEGQDYQSYYLYEWAGVDQTNGQPLWYTDSTRSETTSDINAAERFLVGKSATPDHYGGFNTVFTYKGISLSAQFSYSSGNYIYDSNERFYHGDGALTPRSTTTYAFENRWMPGRTDAKFPQHMWGGNMNSNIGDQTRWLHDASFVRLRNLTVAYNVPSAIVSRMHLRSLRVYTRGVNLWTHTKDKDLHLDPEQAINGIANGLTPAIKTFTFGIDIGL